MVELSQELRRNYCWNTLQFNSERWRENFFIINFHSCPIPLVSKLSFSFSLYFYSRTTSTSDALIQSSSHHIQQYNNFLNIISVNILHFHSFTNSIEPHYTLITFSYSQQLSLQSFFPSTDSHVHNSNLWFVVSLSLCFTLFSTRHTKLFSLCDWINRFVGDRASRVKMKICGKEKRYSILYEAKLTWWVNGIKWAKMCVHRPAWFILFDLSAFFTHTQHSHLKILLLSLFFSKLLFWEFVQECWIILSPPF